MCGIAAILDSVHGIECPDLPIFEVQTSAAHTLACNGSNNLFSALSRRGPDLHHREDFDVVDGVHIALLGCVLSLRGKTPTRQPAQDGKDLLLFNGEIYDIDEEDEQSDTARLLLRLKKAQGDEAEMLHFLDSMRGPWSIIYWCSSSQKLYFGKDRLGRRSLLVKIHGKNRLTIASVASDTESSGFVELPPAGLFFVDPVSHPCRIGLVERTRTILGHEAMERAEMSSASFLPATWLRSVPREAFQSVDMSIDLSAQMFINVFRTSIERRLMLSSRTGEEKKPRFAVLFSGGIDSLFLSLMLDKCMVKSESIDLINVAFGRDEEIELCPDRLNAVDALRELQRMVTKSRSVRLINVDVSPVEADEALNNNVRPLTFPCRQLMDDSIGTSLWFAGRGKGYDATFPSSNAREYVQSNAKVLFSGLGADELMGGYKGRHRTVFRKEGERGILLEMDKDLSRLWSRNFGRDDRVVSDSGRELRHPFLDEDVVRFVASLSLSRHVCDLSKPDGVGDKHLLRRAAKLLGLSDAAAGRPKRAIQFGSRSKHVLERKKPEK